MIALAAAPAGGMIENAGNPRTVQGDSVMGEDAVKASAEIPALCRETAVPPRLF